MIFFIEFLKVLMVSGQFHKSRKAVLVDSRGWGSVPLDILINLGFNAADFNNDKN